MSDHQYFTAEVTACTIPERGDGFATAGAEARWIADSEAGVHGTVAPDPIADARAMIATLTDALEAERARAEKAEAERDAWIETARHHSKAESAFLDWLRSAGEHMRAFGVTICDDGSDAREVLAVKVPECAKAMAARITDLEAERDQALARLAAAYELADAWLGRQYGIAPCVNDLTPADAQAALDKLLAEARLEGWRAGREAAARSCVLSGQDLAEGDWGPEGRDMVVMLEARILALPETKEASDE